MNASECNKVLHDTIMKVSNNLLIPGLKGIQRRGWVAIETFVAAPY